MRGSLSMLNGAGSARAGTNGGASWQTDAGEFETTMIAAGERQQGSCGAPTIPFKKGEREITDKAGAVKS